MSSRTGTKTNDGSAAAGHAKSPIKTPPNPPSTESLFCDICWGKPNKQGMTFQQCRTCGVGVHNECYGVDDNYYRSSSSRRSSNPCSFQCWACRSVGTTVKVRTRDADGQRMRFSITKRPTECCLCSVDDKNHWYHAMHPLYDHYGHTGRHVVLPPDQDHPESRLAFVHTLCAFVICANNFTAGCVYGCTRDGGFQGQDEDEDNSDTSSVNSDLMQPKDTDTSDDSIHHFVFCLPSVGRGGQSDWTRRIADNQKLKCYICGENDRNTFRIPLQCSANNEHEYDEFKRIHQKTIGNDTCYVAMHVGCSIWGRNDVGELPSCRRVYYFPGRDEQVNTAGGGSENVQREYETNLFANVFCHTHAIELVGRVKGATKVRYPSRLLLGQNQASKIRNDPSSSEEAQKKRVIPKRRHIDDVNPDLKRPRHQKTWRR